MSKYKELVVDRETVMESWYLPWDGNKEEGIKILSDKQTGNSRWSIHHELTVKIQDKVYQTTYSTGATEYQDERPWQDEKEVTFIEVRPVEKMITVWEKVPAEEIVPA